jgi:membrane-bound metal-dependent hydrolase YbcI (DUF457 family)
MAQAGIHALVGAAARKISPKQEWLMLGIILGSLFPDLDNFAVAIATVAKRDTHGLHRTFTHSLFTILAALAVFIIIARVTKQTRWKSLGFGLGIGISLHIALDLLIWFNGVELLWPFGGWVNWWENVNPPIWFTKLLDPAEFLFFALFFVWLAKVAQVHKTNVDFTGKLRYWMIAMLVLLVIFTPLNYVMNTGFQTIYGVFYLVSITAAFVITIRMRQTIEAFDRSPAQ